MAKEFVWVLDKRETGFPASLYIQLSGGIEALCGEVSRQAKGLNDPVTYITSNLDTLGAASASLVPELYGPGGKTAGRIDARAKMDNLLKTKKPANRLAPVKTSMIKAIKDKGVLKSVKAVFDSDVGLQSKLSSWNSLIKSSKIKGPELAAATRSIGDLISLYDQRLAAVQTPSVGMSDIGCINTLRHGFACDCLPRRTGHEMASRPGRLHHLRLMTSPTVTTFFDLYFHSQRELNANGAVSKLTVWASEPIVLVLTGAQAVQKNASDYQVVEVPFSGGLFVYGDVVEGTLKLPEQAVQINARVIEVAKDSAGGQPTIDVSGGPPDKPHQSVGKLTTPANSGADGFYTYKFLLDDDYIYRSTEVPERPALMAAGDPGKIAGWIDLRSDSVASIDGALLMLMAVGGEGGEGQEGQQGQDGGAGGRGADFAYVGVADFQNATDGAAAGAGGYGGRGGPGGLAGSGGSVNVRTRAPLATGLITVTCTKGNKGRRGNFVRPGIIGCAADGTAGTPGKGGKGGHVKNQSYPSGHDSVAIGAPTPRPAAAPAPADTAIDGQSNLLSGSSYADLSA